MKTFNEVVQSVFKIPDAEIKDTLTSEDIPEWDSMNYIFFVGELEKNFGFSFDMDEVINAKYLGDLRKIVEARKTT